MIERRALVVDDNADIRESLAVLLELLGFATVAEDCGAKGLARLNATCATSSEFDVAFVDVSMPEMSGYEFAQAYRSMQPNARTVMVAMTGWASARDCERALEAGFDVHMHKPLDMQRLRDLLGALPNRARPAVEASPSIE